MSRSVANPTIPESPDCASSASGSGRACIVGRSVVGYPAGRSAIAEVYPSLWSRGFANEGRIGDQRDAFSIAAWLSRADRNGSLAILLKLDITPPERTARRGRGGRPRLDPRMRFGPRTDAGP